MATEPETPAQRRALPVALILVVIVAIAAIVALRARPCGPQQTRWCRPTSRPAAARPHNATVRPSPATPATPHAAAPDHAATPSDATTGPRWRPRHGELFPGERAVIAPLDVGAALGPTHVFELAHHAEARVMIGLRVDTREGWLRVSIAAGSEIPPRAVEGPYAVTADAGALTSAEVDAAIAALAAVLHRNIAVPPPREMQPIRRATL